MKLDRETITKLVGLKGKNLCKIRDSLRWSYNLRVDALKWEQITRLRGVKFIRFINYQIGKLLLLREYKKDDSFLTSLQCKLFKIEEKSRSNNEISEEEFNFLHEQTNLEKQK